MTALTNQQISNSYGDVLQISNNNNGADTTLRPIKDGKDDSTPLKLSLTEIQLDYAKWPTSDGSSGQVLSTDGAGNLTWETVSSSSQNIWTTIQADSGSTNPDSTSDTLNIQGGSDINTTISNDFLVIEYTGSNISEIKDDSSPQLGGDLDVNGSAIIEGSGGLIEFATAGIVKVNADELQIYQNIPRLRFVDTGSTNFNNILLANEEFKIQNVADNTVYNFLVYNGSTQNLILTGNNITLNNLVWPTLDGSNGQVLTTDGNGNLSFTTVSSGSDENFKVSSNDTTSGYFEEKILAGSNITFSVSNDGGDETLTIDATDTNKDESVKVSSNDTSADFLFNKLTAGSNVTITETNDGSNESITISATDTGITELVEDLSPQLGGELDVNGNIITSNVTDGDIELVPNGTGNVLISNISYPNSDGTAGQVIQTDGAGNLSFADVSSSDESVKVSSNDSSAGYLLSKLTAGSNITLTENNDGNNESLTIDATNTGISEINEDTSPQLGGNLDVNNFDITTTITDGTVEIYPNGTGNLKLAGLNWPTADGASGDIIQTDGSGNLSFTTPTGTDELSKVSNNDTTASYLEDKLVAGNNVAITVNNDGGNETIEIASSGSGSSEDLIGITNSTIIVDGIEVSSNAVNYVSVTNAETGVAPEVAAGGSDANIDLELKPKGTGNLLLDGLVWPNSDGTNGQVLQTDGSGNLSFASVSVSDELLKISANDTTADYLENKIIGGDNVTLTVNNDGMNEALTINATDTGIAAVVDDTTPQLGGNLDVQSNDINTSVTDGNITILSNGTGNIVLNGLNWPNTDGTNGQALVTDGAGNLSFSSISANDEQVKVSSNDTTAGYLDGKLVAGTNVTFTTNNDGSNETLTIDATDTGITAVVDDTSPQLGGDLDVNNFYITNNNTDGNITLKPNSSASQLDAYKLSYTINKGNGSISSGAIIFDATDQNAYTVTLNQNITSITLLADGSFADQYQQLVIRFAQDGTGGYTVSGWPSSVKWPGGTAPTITSAANSVDIVTLQTFDNGTTWYGNFSQDYQ